MMNKRAVISALVVFNIVLTLILLATATSLPRANAQTFAGHAGDFVCVTAKGSGQSYDVLFMLDVPNQKLHAFYPGNVQSKQLQYGKFRDLKADFGRK